MKGVKLKAQRMTQMLRQLSTLTKDYVVKNKELKAKLERIQYKNGLGYEHLTPRPKFRKIFEDKNLLDKDLSKKIVKEQISSENVVHELINRIKFIEN